MPSTVASLLASAGLESGGFVSWEEPVPENRPGVYIVSLAAAPQKISGIHATAPLSDAALDELLAACPDLTLDGEPRPAREQLAERIGSYWLSDECVLYIGLAGQPLSKRVGQYYRTPLGAAKPHKGGWWLKTLSVLRDLHVHYAVTPDCKDAEEDILRAFAAQVSEPSRAALPAGEPVMPFANLRDGDWRRRNHRISGATRGPPAGRKATASTSAAAAATAKRTPRSAARAAAGTLPAASGRAASGTPHHCSQRVTAKDIEAGQVRIPRGATKSLLPRERQDIAVRLRGRELNCRWDPRYGPPERSGVMRVGKAVARELLVLGDVLAVRARTESVILD